ncbi:response regulator [Paenibacillus sp. LHD-117]|uniref:response regulator n=1 Tax=Paenibacillus sp. LHD-117 TaxID=3071412 RepID=UPI0027E0714E|nr:response regulator [Paenibacillus sp. LHD-117]MDQ6422965.1 response regulator [Paenibacillus sp. LHD-117]
MYKVLLVDDDLPDLEGLKRFIPWDDMNMEVAATVNNGMKALSILEEQPIDILVTDIRMPIMSGLELTEQVIKLNKKMKIIFVSSYADFEYAKQAVNLKAFGYVLKPVDDQEIIKLLKKAKDELDQEKTHAPIVRNKLLQEWFLELINTEDVAKVLPINELIIKHGEAAVAVIEIDHRIGMEKDSWFESLVAIVQSCMELDQHSIVMKWFNSSIVMLLQGNEQAVIPLLNGIQETVRTNAEFTITIGLGQFVADAADLQASFKQARQAVQSKLFVSKDRIITAEQAMREVSLQVIDLEGYLASLLHSISEYSVVDIHDSLEEIFRLFQSSRSTIVVYHIIYYILSQVEIYLKSRNENVNDILGVNYEGLHILFEYETLIEMKRKLREILFQCSEKLYFKRQTVPQKLVAEIERYVLNNLDKKITLKDVGDHLAFSGNYLAHLYKNNTGVAFSDFVIQTRMNKAKEMLRNPRLKIFEIAEAVGYRDLPYFTKQFKEYFEVTPSEYRKAAK